MFAKDTKILIVDDMMTMRTLVSKTLKELGFTNITQAENGMVAFEKVQSSQVPFQLIISDWNMPQMTGLELLKAVRALPTGKTLPFVLLTAESEKAQVVQAILAGVNGYVTKPFTAATLEEKLKTVFAATSNPPKAA